MLIHNKVLYGVVALVGMANLAAGIHLCLVNQHIGAIAMLIGGGAATGISLKKIIAGKNEYLNVNCDLNCHFSSEEELKENARAKPDIEAQLMSEGIVPLEARQLNNKNQVEVSVNEL